MVYNNIYGCPMFGNYLGFGINPSWVVYILIIGLLVAGIYWLIKSANRKTR
jgi:hypothetical protein